MSPHLPSSSPVLYWNAERIDRWRSWIASELTPPIKVGEETEHVLREFLSLLEEYSRLWEMPS